MMQSYLHGKYQVDPCAGEIVAVEVARLVVDSCDDCLLRSVDGNLGKPVDLYSR